eukprot:6179815-Pleurochrysis_carterae.AAC.1
MCFQERVEVKAKLSSIADSKVSRRGRREYEYFSPAAGLLQSWSRYDWLVCVAVVAFDAALLACLDTTGDS